MKIEDNIIKNNLKNVLFICGTACAGKTTLSKIIAEKYNFYLYDMDKQYSRHRKIVNETHQPDTCYHGKNFHEQWMRPIEEQARWSISSIREQSEIVLLDLMKLSEHQTVVADVLYSPDYNQSIIDYNQLVFLTVDKSLIRSTYFNRPEKLDFFEYVKSQELSEIYFENIFQSLELINELECKKMKDSGFYIIERTKESTIEDVQKLIEKHFGLL